MLDMELIENTIQELEADDTTFNNCQKLASLYIIKEYYKNPNMRMVNTLPTDVHKELSDILPHYEQYCEIKTKYQMHQIDKEPVVYAFSQVCKEIQEFLKSLYSSTDMQEERELLYTVGIKVQ